MILKNTSIEGFFFSFSLLKSFAGQEQDDEKTNIYSEHFNLKHKT